MWLDVPQPGCEGQPLDVSHVTQTQIDVCTDSFTQLVSPLQHNFSVFGLAVFSLLITMSRLQPTVLTRPHASECIARCPCRAHHIIVITNS